jgi:CheY-like chemotaxis protein
VDLLFSPDDGKAVCILLVEDEALIRMNLADYLAEKGFVVVEASNSSEAVDALQNSTPAIDVIFSDVRMPGKMDGLALTKWVRQNYPGLPVILTSGDVGQANFSASGYPGESLLPKPYELRSVAAKIMEVMDARTA